MSLKVLPRYFNRSKNSAPKVACLFSSNISVFSYSCSSTLHPHQSVIQSICRVLKQRCFGSRELDQFPFYRSQVNLGSNLWVCMSVCPTLFTDITDVTLLDDDTNAKLTDEANRAVLDNVEMQVVPPATWWPNLQTIAIFKVLQVAPPRDQISIQCKWHHLR